MAIIKPIITITASPNHINHDFKVLPKATNGAVTVLVTVLAANDGKLDTLGNCGYVYAHGIPST